MDQEDEILALERAALDRWCRGDPSGFLELSAPDVVYFDPFRERQLDGVEFSTALEPSPRPRLTTARTLRAPRPARARPRWSRPA